MLGLVLAAVVFSGTVVAAPPADAAPQTFVVTTASDEDTGGCDLASCTLREAIDAANRAPFGRPSTIAFGIPGSGPFSIRPDAPLPQLNRPITLDATTQPGWQGAPLIELNFARSGDGLDLCPGGDGHITIRGFAINRADDRGIDQECGFLMLEHNYIGTDLSGTVDLGNSGSGLLVWKFDTSGGVIRHNVISGNGVNGFSSFIGGFFVIEDNLVGTDVTGTVAIPNGSSGIRIDENDADVARNVISGNSGDGLFVRAGSVRAFGNRIGTDVTGMRPLGNGGVGVRFMSPDPSVLGGAGRGRANVIAASAGAGVSVENDSDDEGVLVQNNRIGTDLTGAHDLGNAGPGVVVVHTVDDVISSTIVGGSSGDVANRIAFNGGAGVEIVAATGVAVRMNRVYANGGLAIDLDGDGVTPNDPGDADTGANDRQNFPVMTSATAAGRGTHVVGTLDSLPSTTFDVDVFTSDACDPSGYGEAGRALGTTQVTTGADGRGEFQDTFAKQSIPGQVVTAVATLHEPATSPTTSEVSACVVILTG